MKKIAALITGLITLLTTLSTFAQQKQTPAKDRSLLWKISGKHLPKPSYLFGTIHLICSEDFLWTQKMKESFGVSEKICFEMDLDNPEVMLQASMGLMDKTGKKLREYFTAEQYKTLEQYFSDSLGMDIAMFEQLKPVALLSMLGTTGVSCANPVSYEDSLMKIAQADNKEILGLEEPQEQLDVLASIPTDSVVKQLMDAMENNASNDNEFAGLINAYKNQDLPKLYELLTTSKDQSLDLGMFLEKRNKNWIPRITTKMLASSVFFAVGAGHLYGETGVINLLRREGYKVEAVK